MATQCTMPGHALLSITCVVLTLCILPMAVGGIITSKDAGALKASLIKDYDRTINPSKEYMKPTNVSASFIIDAIGSINEKLEKMSTLMTLVISWTDELITWNYTDTGIMLLPFDKSEVWVPEYFVYNTHYDISYIKQDLQLLVTILHYGQAMFVQRLVAESSCSLDMTNFPFDRHTCTIEFVLNKENADVIPSFEKPNLDEFSPDGTWDIIDIFVAEDSQRNRVIVNIAVARKPTFFIVNLISPMTMLALLSPLVFLLPYNSGERIGFSVTILLSLSVFMTMIADQVPQKSQPLPRLIYMVFLSYCLTTLAVIIVVINARIHDFSDRIPVPCCIVALVTCMKCFCYCFKRRSALINDELKQNKVADAGLKDTETEVGNKNGKEDRIATWQDVLPRDNPGFLDDACLGVAEAEVGYKKANNFGAVTWQDVSWAIDMLAMTIIYLLKITLLALTFATLESADDGAD